MLKQDTLFSGRLVEEREVEWWRVLDHHIWIQSDCSKYEEFCKYLLTSCQKTPGGWYVLSSPVHLLQMKTHAEKPQFDLDIAW